SMYQTQEETHTPIDRGRFGLYVGLGLFLVVTGGLSLRYMVGSVFRLSTFISRFIR
ncbi:hypothetical protein XENOCAPTIV_004194, partial [Xenoophorus captivus]